jgi:hypothetical protein
VEKTAAIIAVIMPFENRYPAFKAIRNARKTKYDHTVDQYQQAYNVFVDACIVGALDGWDPANK